MKRYLVATSLAIGLSMSLGWAPASIAKPSDLPADDKIHCPDGQVKGEHGGVALDLDLLSTPASVGVEPAVIDTVNPMVIQACVEQWLQKIGSLFPLPGAPTEQQSRQEFEVAERCRQSGDFRRARNLYQHVHLLTPTTRLGRLAIERLIELEQRLREAAEEAEPPVPAPESSRLDPFKPLGLVEVTY